jgi:hypothetical protein
MATTFQALLTPIRNHLIEVTPKFWSDIELLDISYRGARDLWRDVVDLKQEHYLTVDITNVSLPANSTQLLGVPADVHKVYMIEPRDITTNGNNHGLLFKPLEYNNTTFQLARSRDAIDASNDTIYYAVTQQGAPVGAPVILVAPKTTSIVPIAFSYVPILGPLTATSVLPIPGEADNAIIAWTVAFAAGKQEDGGGRAPDAAWLAIYSSEKGHLLQSLGLRGYQEPQYVDAMMSEYW